MCGNKPLFRERFCNILYRTKTRLNFKLAIVFLLYFYYHRRNFSHVFLLSLKSYTLGAKIRKDESAYPKFTIKFTRFPTREVRIVCSIIWWKYGWLFKFNYITYCLKYVSQKDDWKTKKLMLLIEDPVKLLHMQRSQYQGHRAHERHAFVQRT